MDAKKQPIAKASQLAPEAELTFEQALANLETIVESMEAGDTPLAKLLVQYEEGNKLLKLCEVRLKDAEVKIEMLKKQKSGAPAFVPFPVADRETGRA